MAENRVSDAALVIENGAGQKILNYAAVQEIEGAELSQLQAGTVLEIIYLPEDVSDRCSVKILQEHVQGQISMISYDSNYPADKTYQLRAPAGNTVDKKAAYGAYGTEKLRFCYSGEFYFDSYGQIAAFFWNQINSFFQYGIVHDYQTGKLDDLGVP